VQNLNRRSAASEAGVSNARLALKDRETAIQFWVGEENHGVSMTLRLMRVLLSLGMVASVAGVCLFVPHVSTAAVVLVLLLVILMIASRWDFWEGAAATGLAAAFLAYFFLPPEGWSIQSAEHWLVFFTFLIVALLASHFAARVKHQADQAIARRRDLEKLHVFAQELHIEGSSGSIVAGCLDSLVRIFEVEAAVFYNLSTGEITRSGWRSDTSSADLLHEAADRSDLLNKTATGVLCVPLHSGDQMVGSLAVCGGGISAVTLRAIADCVEAGLEKVRAYETRRNQELKTALLDSLVHEIKTPLSVVKTAASSLLSSDMDAVSRRELLTLINEEADRLDASISAVFRTARVEAGTLPSHKGPHDIHILVNQTLQELKALLGKRPVTVEIPDRLPPANCNFSMIRGVLQELLTNALKYSPSDSPLTISVRHSGEEIVISVTDFGIGVAPGEERRIFEKHYRGSVGASGTGLGLAIAKTIVESHGGQIGVSRKLGAGSVFRFSLPVSDRDVA